MVDDAISNLPSLQQIDFNYLINSLSHIPRCGVTAVAFIKLMIEHLKITGEDISPSLIARHLEWGNYLSDYTSHEEHFIIKVLRILIESKAILYYKSVIRINR